MKTPRTIRFWLPAVLLLALTGCQSARMAIPADLEARSEALPCVGRGGFTISEKFSFGPYAVTDVHRGWTRRVTWGIVFYEHSSARQQYEFTLQAPSGRTWHGQAATGATQEDLKTMVARGELTLGVSRKIDYVARLGQPGGDKAWTLVLSEGTGQTPLKGSLTSPDSSYHIEGSRQLAGTTIPLMENAGFLIRKGSRLVTAVDGLNAGSVFLARELAPEEREPLAAAAAALLLYRDISR